MHKITFEPIIFNKLETLLRTLPRVINYNFDLFDHIQIAECVIREYRWKN